MMLSDLKETQWATISRLPDDYIFSLRLCEMGLCTGQKVQCVAKSLFSSPVLYCVKDSLLAIRLADAKRIEVSQ